MNEKPNGICDECAKNQESQPAIYCQHHHAGAFKRPLPGGNEIWVIHQPLDEQSFRDVLTRAAKTFQENLKELRSQRTVSIN